MKHKPIHHVKKEKQESAAAVLIPQGISRSRTDVQHGLTSAAVTERLSQGLSNAVQVTTSRTMKSIIIENVCTYFNLVFTIIAFLLILVGSYRNLTFYGIIIANTAIGILQEYRSKQTLDRLQVIHAPKATVRRDGETRQVAVDELVLDDIVEFASGNQICADAVVVSGKVQVNESLITGESDEITKEPGDCLLSGSFVVSGTCHAQLTQVGADSYVSRLTIAAKASKKGEQSEMIRSLNRLVKIVGILIIPIGLILFGQQYFFLGNSFRVSVVGMVAAILGMIPEGLYLLASIALVVSVMRLAKKKVLVNDMKCIESLARVDVLCVDKTGTITENSMEVVETKQLAGCESNRLPDFSLLLGRFVDSLPGENHTMKALKAYFRQSDGVKPEAVTTFSSVCKYSSATFKGNCYVLGAPEFVLRESYEQYRGEIEEHASKGYRVLVFGLYDGQADGKALTAAVTALGLIMLTNPIRKEAKQTFEYFVEQGVEVKVISGDNPLTVTEVAKKAGIRNADNYVDASTLTTEAELYQAAARYTIFGRVNPNQKRQLVRALKSQGHTVAMTGDGVNDILALKDADCSIAMASGSDATAKAAQLVLLDSNFACMPSVVLEGRRVVNNIQRSASLFLVKNIFSFLLSFFSVAYMVTYPLEPSQLSLISLFTIGYPAFLLALEANEKRIEGHFLSNVLLNALPAGLTDFIVISTFVVFCKTFEVEPSDVSTACALIMTVVGLLILLKISRPLNKYRSYTLGLMMIGIVFTSYFLNDLFGLKSISMKTTMLLCIFALVTEPMLRYLSLLTEKTAEYYRNRKERKSRENKKITV
ncbi:MAG: cation-translocating P-type ATPase [Lachnospiraceae bacterium]|nr:cation-translocating P-type ATPase [Lachnospiraceae bacterium]MDY5741652.1 cation-translocating P-type ATPase [Lachnospiraceae bacterium]